MNRQLSQFDWRTQRRTAAHARGHGLDPSSQALLDRYRDLRLINGGHPGTVAREVSQLGSLVRELGATASLPGVFRDAPTLAGLLLEPSALVSASTGRCRLIAAQRFARLCGDEVGIADGDRFLIELDRSLPARTRRDWHSVGTLVAATRSRRRPLRPTLDPADLERIVAAVTARSVPRERRDRGLVALHCYTGLRPDELAELRWSQVAVDPESEETTLHLRRDGRWLSLPIAGPGASALLALRWAPLSLTASEVQYVFPRSEKGERPLTTRAAREIVPRACKRAGFPLASAADLRAAFAYWLQAWGLSDHESAAVLGLRQGRSLDRLLARHRSLDAQRRVREMQPGG